MRHEDHAPTIYNLRNAFTLTTQTMNSATVARPSLKRPIGDVNGPAPAMANGRVVQKRTLLTTEMERFRHNRELPLNLILLITAHVS